MPSIFPGPSGLLQQQPIKLQYGILNMEDINQFRELLAKSNRAVVFTGAGISTESGIPGFRGPNGLWSRFKPTNYQDFIG